MKIKKNNFQIFVHRLTITLTTSIKIEKYTDGAVLGAQN